MNIISAIKDDRLFKPLFKDLSTWWGWLVFLAAVFALPMTERMFKFYQKCTNRLKPTSQAMKIVVAIIARRAGKSAVISYICTYLALFFDYSEYLSPSERGSIIIVSPDRQQSRVIFNYISGILHSQPIYEAKILSETKERIQLTNRIDIEILTASHRTIRGRSVVAWVIEEAAFMYDVGARPDIEIFRSLKPATATIPNAMGFIISSPYSQSGLLYQMHREYFGKDDPEVLVWQANSLDMNPTLDEEIIKRDLETDRESAEAEWLGQFRKDLSNFLSIEVIENCIIKNRFELPFVPNVHYSAFTDPSGGGGTDAMTLAIAHKEEREDGEVLVLDSIRAKRPPFDPYEVAAEFAQRY